MHKGWYKDIEEDDDNGFAQFGGYMEAKKAKLIKQVREQAGTERQSAIFKGISIFVNGFTKPSAEELKTLMGLHGGVYHVYQMPSTTHIIASNLPNVKINKLGPLPIVKPSWIEDSITLGRLLDYTGYLLYTNQNRMQPKLNFDKVSDSLNLNTTKGKTASDPSFLSEFYGNSRLHLIATLGAESKQFINDIRAQAGPNHTFIGLQRLIQVKSSQVEVKSMENVEKDDFSCALSLDEQPNTVDVCEVIMHIDMDCFFVSVGVRNRPELKGKPVAVTHSKTGQGRVNVDRSAEIAMYKERLPEGATFRLQDIDDKSSLSEIASCSYEARMMGVKNGMFMGQALKLCPELRAIPYDFDDYKEVSKILYTTICEYTHNIEAVSCDEMYVNITQLLETTALTVPQFAAHIRAEIKQRTGCPCSTGFGANRLQARMATKRAKPDGQYHLQPGEVLGYFNALPLEELPGVGRAMIAKLRTLGLTTCGDVQSFSVARLQRELGLKMGENVHEQASGVDRRPLQYSHARKSVSAEVNYGIRFGSRGECLEFVRRLAAEVTQRLGEIGMRARCVTLKLMVRAEDAPTETAKYLGHGICDTISKSTSLPTAANDAHTITKEVLDLLEKLAAPYAELRGVGIQLSKLETGPKINPLLKNFLEKPSTSSTTVTANTSIKSTQIPTIDTRKTKTAATTGRGKQKRKGTDLSTFFKTKGSATKAATVKNDTTHKITASDIDVQVLQELPEDIRREIIQQYNLGQDKGGTSTRDKNSFVDNIKSTRGDIPEGVQSKKSAAKKREVRKTGNEDVAGFDALGHEEFMDMLGNWCETQSKPEDFDVVLLGKYFQQLATQRKIERLHVYMRFLYRNINEKQDNAWKNAYQQIATRLQQGMLATYKNKLQIASF